jgi:SAM-dependent methyltransferase
MEYLPPVGSQPQQPAPQQGGALKYTGAVATGYDAKREQSPKWIIEQGIIEGFLDDLPVGTWVLDVPCGTGRFFDTYARKGFICRAMDVSADMIAQATRKVQNPTAMIGDVAQFGFRHGDMFKELPKLPPKCMDATVNCRITRWIMGEHGPAGVQEMLRQMQRIARQRVIFTARVKDHPFAVGYPIIEGALDGWKIARDEAGSEPAYRIIELRPEAA